MPVRIKRDEGFEGTSFGSYQISTAPGAWTDIDGSNFDVLTGAPAPTAASAFVDVSVRNTHATQTLYVLLRTSAAEAVADSAAIPAGDTLAFSGLLSSGGAGGSNVLAMALQGSGGATTGQVIASFLG
jgi:hypothetical protein|tara:strand:- start:1879 stop:2262 length:384 start_codon:yes stop_codon:yes gene_type:complete